MTTLAAAPFFHLAQLNIARMRAPIGDPVMADFVAQLDIVNAVADASPGFVWRLAGDNGSAVGIGGFDDPTILVNMSVWHSLTDLRAYVYAGAHREVVRDRRRWFERFDGPYQVLWWVPAGHRPSVAEARERLVLLRRHGPTLAAFTFAQPFDAPPGPAMAQEAAAATPPPPISYDGRVFAMTVNDAAGDCAPDTLFHYRQQGLRVWATYGGRDVRLGALVAQSDERGHLRATYLHVAPGGAVRTGACETAPELLPDGRLRLSESWRWLQGAAPAGAVYTSVLEEVAPELAPRPVPGSRIVADSAQIV